MCIHPYNGKLLGNRKDKLLIYATKMNEIKIFTLSERNQIKK